jgi:hypothetical protein
MDVTFGRSKEKKTAYFELSLLDLSSKLTLKDRVYLTEGSAWKADALCKSMGHTLPAGQYRLQIDDLINRPVFGVIHYQILPSGAVTAQMKTYWTRAWAIQQDDKLANIPDPKGVLGSLELSLVEESSAPIESTSPPPPPKQETPPPAATPEIPPPTNSPAGEAKASPADDDEMEGISDTELAEAFAYAKRLRAQKESHKTAGK